MAVRVKIERGCQRLWNSGLDLAPPVVHRQPDHLPGRRRPFLLRRTQAQMMVKRMRLMGIVKLTLRTHAGAAGVTLPVRITSRSLPRPTRGTRGL